jgi:hypothetical protein
MNCVTRRIVREMLRLKLNIAPLSPFQRIDDTEFRIVQHGSNGRSAALVLTGST